MAEALIITGPCGAGKTTIAFECLELLETARIPAAMIDAELVYYHPAPSDDPHKERVAERALAALWEIYRGEGIERLLLPRVLLHPPHLELVRRAVPVDRLAVAWLDVPDAVVAARLGARERGSALDWHLQRAREVRASGMRARSDVHVDADRPIGEVGLDLLQKVKWLTSV